MPIKRLTQRQVANVLRKLIADPSISWASLARQYNVTTPAMRQLILRRMPDDNPDWTHQPKGRKLRTCDSCGESWQETRGYGGPGRRYCGGCRGRTRVAK